MPLRRKKRKAAKAAAEAAASEAAGSEGQPKRKRRGRKLLKLLALAGGAALLANEKVRDKISSAIGRTKGDEPEVWTPPSDVSSGG